MNKKLLQMLSARGQTIASISAKLHPTGSKTGRASLSETLNGKRSIYRKSGQLVPTWARLKAVLPADEFDCAISFALEQRRNKIRSSPRSASSLRAHRASGRSVIYLAVPYSHEDPLVVEQRVGAVNRVAADMMRRGLHVFSPISHTHPIAQAGNLPNDWKYWEAYDRAMLAACCKLAVLKLPGWEQSEGVRAEIALAKEMRLPVEYLDEAVAFKFESALAQMSN